MDFPKIYHFYSSKSEPISVNLFSTRKRDRLIPIGMPKRFMGIIVETFMVYNFPEHLNTAY